MVWQQNIHGYSKVNIVSGIQPKTSAGESSVKLAPAPQSPASTQTQQMAQLTGAPVSPLHPYIFPAATTFSYLAALISADDCDLPLALGGASLGLAGVTAYTRRTNILGYTNLTEAQYNKYTQALGPITDLALRGVLAMTATNVAFRALDAAGVSYNSLMTGALVATSAALLTIPRTRQTLVKSRGVAASTVGATWSVAKNITTRIVQTAAKNSLVIYGGIAAAAAWWGYHNADHV